MKSNKYLWLISVVIFFFLLFFSLYAVCSTTYHVLWIKDQSIEALKPTTFNLGKRECWFTKNSHCQWKFWNYWGVEWRTSALWEPIFITNLINKWKILIFSFLKINYCYASLHLFDHNLPALWQTMTIYLLLVFRCIFLSWSTNVNMDTNLNTKGKNLAND